MLSQPLRIGAITVPEPLVMKLRTGPRRSWISSSLLPMGTIVAILFAATLGRFFPAFTMIALILSVGFITWLMNVLIHEFGHFSAAWCLGWTIHAVAIGPLMVSRELGKPRLSIQANGCVAGFVAATPRDAVQWRTQEMLFIAAGPVLQILFGVYLLGLAIVFSPAAWDLAMYSSGGFIILTGAMQLIPFQVQGLENDGAKIRTMVQGGWNAERAEAVTQLAVLAQTGPRPREWDESLVARAISGRDATYQEYAASIFAFHYSFDRGELHLAAELLQRAVDIAATCPDSMKLAPISEVAFLAARQRMDLQMCRMVRDRLALELPEVDLYRLRAAIALAEGQRDIAAQHVRAALDFQARTQEHPGGLEYWLLVDLLVEAERQEAA